MTLKDTLNAELTKLKADLAATQTESAAKEASIKADIATAEGHLVNFGAWLEKEASEAKTAIVAFFEKYAP